MAVCPGMVVLVNFSGAAQTKPRPAVVISTDLYHANRPDVVLAVLTTQLARAKGPTDYVLRDWAAAGLHHPTAFRAYLNTHTADDVLKELGQLSDRDWQEVQARLRLALAVT